MRKKKEKNQEARIMLTPMEQLKALADMTIVTTQQQKLERDDLYRSLLDIIMDSQRPQQVVHPYYYNQGGKETIEKICDITTPLGAYLFSKGNVIKYEDRAEYKGQYDTDMKKIREYGGFASVYAEKMTPNMRKHWRAIQEEWREIQRGD